MSYYVDPAHHHLQFCEIGHGFFVSMEALAAARKKAGLFCPLTNKVYELSAYKNRKLVTFRVLVLSVRMIDKGKNAYIMVKMKNVDTDKGYSFPLPQFSACAPKEYIGS